MNFAQDCSIKVTSVERKDDLTKESCAIFLCNFLCHGDAGKYS